MTITFHDAAAYFSEEEWKLLHEWQRELYENVMKEIHQALIALGPLIATTVVSLKAKEKQDICAVEDQDSARWHMVDCSPVTGHQIANADTSIRIHDRNETRICRPIEPARSLDISEPSTDFSFVKTNIGWKKEEQQNCFVDQSGAEDECSMSPSSGQEVVSFIKKEQTESYYLDSWDIENGGSNNRFTSSRIMNRSMKSEDSMDCTKKTSCKVAFRKEMELVVQESTKGINCIIDLETEMNAQLEEESSGECQSPVPKTSNSNPDPLAFKIENSSVSSEVERYTDKTFLECESSIQPNWSQYAFPEHKNNLGLREQPNDEQRRPHRRHRPYHCAICEQTFMGKSDLARHQTKHTGEKPYQCEECNKSFTRKGTLVIHQRIHSGERPYHCPDCQDCFRDKKQLISHLKYHQE